MKLTKEDIDKVRHIEGFPIGNDEDIIALSNPPYYTACPNPFIEDFIKKHGTSYDEKTDEYKREPFAADVSEGKNDPIYNAHSYHTKVPHKAIMRYILHYTEPGDIIFDGFCGTGMTGVAAQMCGNPDTDPEFKLKIETEMPGVKWGARKAILNDLSPAATFIAYNYNTPVDVAEFEKEANRILDKCEAELGWMYETYHVDENGNQVHDMTGPVKGKINYTVWSDVFICPNCGSEIVFWDVAVDEDKKRVKDTFECNNCKIELKKTDCDRAVELIYDDELNETISMAKQVPVLINYIVGTGRYEKKPDENDLTVIVKINNMKIPYWYPVDRMIEGSESRRNDKFGITHVHHFFYKRVLAALASYNSRVNMIQNKWILTSVIEGSSKLNRERPGGMPSKLSGTLYVSSMIREIDAIAFMRRKINRYKAAYFNKDNNSIISVNSTTDLSNIHNNSIDYIFTDPPFGSNLNYSELSFIWEAWLKVITNNKSEAIINSSQGKGLVEYQELMTKCFEEYYRVLKPNRWMTVEFHNSKNSVWNAIQESLIRAGFIIADVRTLDKKQGSFKQVTTTSAVKQDLVISAYKPKESFKRRFFEKAGTEETVWDFVREHLDKLPVVVQKDNMIEVVKEREPYLLFDRMVAYHIMAGMAVPIDAADFYKGLDERFLKRDGMYFTHDQINEYDDARIISEIEPIQFDMFVTDERSAIAWLYHQLEEPQTYSEIQPKFMKEAKTARYEKMPELGELLEENFLQDEEGRWYIPDLSKSGDIIKLREKRLLKEFEEYLAGKGRLTLFRTEAVRVGFAKLWKDKDYKNIVKVGNRLPESVIQEDDKLLMYYDIALSRVE
jgi:DNA modification methylase/predicted RNA-binding Zn-ribbon protein involved in translation (DUF1610 family)